MKTRTSTNTSPRGLCNSPKSSLATSQRSKMLKIINKILALILLFAGLSVVQDVGATNYIHEAVGIYGSSHTTNNTWSKTGTVNTGDECATTALSSKITVTLSKGYIGANAMTVYGKSNLKIQCSTGVKVYRVVFSPADGEGTAAQNLSCNGSGSINQSTWWSASDDGNNSITFTGLDADDSFKIVHLNIYIRYEATAAQATITPTSVTMSAQDVDTYNFTLTTNESHSFDGSSNWFKNLIKTSESSSDIDFDDYNLYGEYTNNSKIPATIYAYNEGTYTANFCISYSTGSNDNHSYYAKALELPFTIVVEDNCTDSRVVWNSPSPSIANYNAIPCTTTSFTRTATAQLKDSPNTATGQTIVYSSTDEDVAEVSSSGVVTINGVGTTTIKATANSDGTYCKSENTYDITVTGYTVTLHYPACVADASLTGTSKTFTNVCGAFNLNYDMAIDGYKFMGWSPSSSTLTTRYTGSVTVSANADYYAVYGEVSNEFVLCDKNTAVVEGDYVITGSYSQGSTKVMTNVLNKGKFTANETDYTITSAKKLTCKEESCIWHIASTTGGWTIKNLSNGKYLSAIGGDVSSTDYGLRLVDAIDNYSVWTITQNSVMYDMVNKKRSDDSETNNMLRSYQTNYAFYKHATGTSPFLFKRTASSSTLTTDPLCNRDEFKVTIVDPAVGGTAEATATGTEKVWDKPVLSKLYGSEIVTLTAQPATGYQFSSWTAKRTDTNASITVTSNQFTMPTANVTVTPNFTPQTYNITYKDQGNTTFSGTHASGYPTTHTYGTATTLLTATKTGYVFMGWYTDSGCTGSPVATLGATEYTADITLYALFLQLSDPLAWCPEPTVTLTGDNVYVTGTYRTNGAVMAVNQLTLNANNLIAGGTVRLSTPANSGVYFTTTRGANFTKSTKPTATVDITADAGGDITDQTIYVHYLPAAAATAGATAAPQDITVTATYQNNTDYYSTQDVHVRNLPAAFAIATKIGNSWYALPANMSGADNPQGVLIDVDETAWTAKGPATLNYTLWPVKTTNGSGDLYETKGEKLRFAGNSDKGLWANNSTSAYTVNNNAAITTLGADVTTAYEWAVTTTVAGTTWKYTLTTAQTNNTNDLNYWQGRWGTYNSGSSSTAVNEVYFIPITVVEDANIVPMEWGLTEVALKCAASTVLIGVTIDGTAVTGATLTSLTGDIMKLAGLPNLWDNKMKKMIISVSEDGTAKQIILNIPFILTESNSPVATPLSTINLRNFAEGSSQDKRNDVIINYDVVVRSGAQLNVTTASGEATACTFNDLYIYPGGKVDISGNNLGVQNVYLRGGFSWLDNKATFLLPQMKVANGRSIVGPGTAGNGIYYDFYGDFNMYYMLALPKDVPASALTNEENGDDWYANIKYYDGSERVLDPKGNKSWKWITGESTLTRGIGYEVAVKPRSGRTIGILRFPLLTGAWANETDAAPSVTAHGKAGYEATPPTVTANNVGWNLMGNPFFSAFTNNGSNMYIYELVQHIENGHWTGTYDFNTEEGYKLKYFTIPNKTDYDYVDVRATDYKLEAFWPFFIQANATGSLTFASANRILRKPLMANNTLREVIIDFSLINGDKEDKAGLNISDNYSDKFDMEDKEKTLDNGIEFMKVYTLMDGYRIAFNSITEATAATLVPVGYIAPKQGEYTFTMPQTLNLSEVEAVYLTDFETGAVTDLVFDDYTFTTAKGQFDERFALTVVLKAPHVATDITEQLTDGTSNLDGVKISSDEGVIILRGLPQGASLWVYDATGKLYDSQKGINGGRIVLPVKVAGAYNVHVKAQGESVTLKTVVR